MGFLRTANSQVLTPQITWDHWFDQSHDQSVVKTFKGRTASVQLVEKFDPSKYLLTHCTIVASVDVEESGLPIGKFMDSGLEIDRQYTDFRVTPETSKFINNNCFVAGTLITMGDGTLKAIEDVQVGDTVITHKGRERKVLKTFVTPLENTSLVEIKARGSNERLLCTQEHPFYVLRPEEKCVNCPTPMRRDIRCVSRLLGKNYCSKQCYYALGKSNASLLDAKTPEFVSASELTRFDFITNPVLQENLDVGLTLGKARLLGLFAAEGYYDQYKETSRRKGVSWALNSTETETLARDIQRLVKSEFGVEATIYPHSEDNGIHVTARSPELVEFCEHWVSGVAKTKRLHSDLLRASKEIQTEVLRGWLDGDGSLVTTSTCFLSGNSASKSLTNQMALMLNRQGLSSRLYHGFADGRKVVRDESGKRKVVSDPSKQLESWNLYLGMGAIGNLVETTRFEAGYVAWLEANEAVQAVPELRFFKGLEVQIIDTLKTVDGFTGTVHNFEVEEDNSYVANNIAVHNCDSFERKLLLSSFKTFIGAENYQEHCQIKELSKGRIIDAAARDIGDSIYIDILVATEFKHQDLVRDILSQKMRTLSMGANVSETTCTKCGNVAYDETQLCVHIKYQKGNTFIASNGKTYKIAELCGHYTRPNSVRFIEASWVANPAFKGAVLRNIFDPRMSGKMILNNLGYVDILKSASPEADPNQVLKAAAQQTQTTQQGQGQATQQVPFEVDEQPTQGAPEEKPQQDANEVVDQLAETIKQKALEKAKNEVSPPPQLGEWQSNDNLVKQAMLKVIRAVRSEFASAPYTTQQRIAHASFRVQQEGWAKVAGALSSRDILEVSKVLDRVNGVVKTARESSLYSAVEAVGGVSIYRTSDAYLAACRRVIGRSLTASEIDTLLTKGRLYDLGQSKL